MRNYNLINFIFSSSHVVGHSVNQGYRQSVRNGYYYYYVFCRSEVENNFMLVLFSSSDADETGLGRVRHYVTVNQSPFW